MSADELGERTRVEILIGLLTSSAISADMSADFVRDTLRGRTGADRVLIVDLVRFINELRAIPEVAPYIDEHIQRLVFGG